MQCAWSMILLIVYLILCHSTDSLSSAAVGNETIIPFTGDMLPMLTNFTSINSSAIQVAWQPSPAIEGINTTQLDGLFSIGLYTGNQQGTPTICIVEPINKLSEIDQTTMGILKPNTVYHACFQSKWHAHNTTIDCFDQKGPYRRDCQLVRTYMDDQKTLNAVPPFGEYTWKQIATNTSKLAIVINATISSVLPYVKRNITVTFGGKNQSRAFETPLESVEFEFDGLALESKDYPLLITFMLIDQNTAQLFTASKTFNETIRTTAPSMGNKLVLCNSLFLVFLTVFVSLWYKENV